jgi:hypothetical protein
LSFEANPIVAMVEKTAATICLLMHEHEGLRAAFPQVKFP